MGEDIKALVEFLRDEMPGYVASWEGEFACSDADRSDAAADGACLARAADALEQLAQENEELRRRVRHNSFAGEGYAIMEARVAELEVERDELKEEYHAFEREVEQREGEFARKMGALEARAEATEARVAELEAGREAIAPT